ncbi:MAG: acetyl-CoA carboxylase biotin carboxyl carrier protein [Bacteriovoracaceae bacterium]|nr:acetyl-CoA carboxylase biotin carboxyl carrier protein [Bacteriovoracaceae bacterium]
MDFKKLAAFIELAKKNGVSQLQYENSQEKYSVEFLLDDPVALSSAESVLSQYPTELKRPTIVSEPAETQKKKEKVDKNIVEVTSPFVGTFYIAPSPGAKPYVKVGDVITPGSILCIVEAMKIMNEIASEINGEIVEVCAKNETAVEFGQTLFKLRI